jgi:hypothetical protein
MDPYQNPDPTPFFSDFVRMQNIFFFIFFSYNLPAGTLSSALKILFSAKILRYNLILKTFDQFAQHLCEKMEVRTRIEPYL